MRYLAYLFTGLFFGILMYKSEAASWFRIYEMFQFGSFHMYGIIGSAVVLGILGTQWIKRRHLKTVEKQEIIFTPKAKTYRRYLIGGFIFGLGWALAGACPGPMFVMLGAGFPTFLIVIIGALLGTFSYGLLRKHLPH